VFRLVRVDVRVRGFEQSLHVAIFRLVLDVGAVDLVQDQNACKACVEIITRLDNGAGVLVDGGLFIRIQRLERVFSSLDGQRSIFRGQLLGASFVRPSLRD